MASVDYVKMNSWCMFGECSTHRYCNIDLSIIGMFSLFFSLHTTRAPRGTDRSPEYKEHFCYKLDSRVKNETTEWNQKQQHFITHALDHSYEFGLFL